VSKRANQKQQQPRTQVRAHDLITDHRSPITDHRSPITDRRDDGGGGDGEFTGAFLRRA
jgi:hypothetical protein